MISILVPSYGRADKIPQLAENIRENTFVDYEILVMVETEQRADYYATCDGLPHVKVYENERTRNYAGAINTAANLSTFENIFMGSDDIKFHPEWDTEALKVMHALDNIKVVGTNDLYNGYVLNGVHATHYLVSMEYIELTGGVIDGNMGHVLFEGYDHNYTDTEFIGTAKARCVFQPCLTSIVEHIGWTTNEFNDSTKGKTNERVHDDATLYLSRRELWVEMSK